MGWPELTLSNTFVKVICFGFPGGSDGRASASNTGDLGSIPGSGRSPGGGNGTPLQYSCLEKSHGQRSLVGYSLWSRKESDMTERLFSFLFVKVICFGFSVLVTERERTPWPHHWPRPPDLPGVSVTWKQTVHFQQLDGTLAGHRPPLHPRVHWACFITMNC